MMKQLLFPIVIIVGGVIILVVACRHWGPRPENELQLGDLDNSLNRGLVIPGYRAMLAAPVVLISFGCFQIFRYLASERSLSGFETIFKILEFTAFAVFVVSALLTFSLIFLGFPKWLIPERFRNG